MSFESWIYRVRHSVRVGCDVVVVSGTGRDGVAQDGSDCSRWLSVCRSLGPIAKFAIHLAWPELTADLELPLAADMLLRQLNEPRRRDSILDAALRWAAAPPVPLEDEEAEKSQQAQIHELANGCLPFLQRFFAMWD